ncbi:N/A [soil metagenome]
MSVRAGETPVLDALEDTALAHRADADFDAFAELYRRYLVSVFRFVRSQTRDDATAEDLTAQVFFRALSSAGTYKGEGSYRAWLFRIAHNTLKSHRSTEGRSALTVPDLPEREDPEPSPPAQAMAGEARDFVRHLVAQLPPAQREVVALHYLGDFTIEEVAAATDRSRGAVRILLHRARARLRRALQGKGEV